VAVPLDLPAIAGGQARGLAVHAAARVAALAGPGEILVSATTRDLLDGQALGQILRAVGGTRPAQKPAP